MKTKAWLETFEQELKDKGYRKHLPPAGSYADYCYDRVITDQEEKIYQNLFLIYTHQANRQADTFVGVQFECYLLGLNKRIDLTVSCDCESIEQYETMAKQFYQSMKQFKTL